ncbi:MAG: hypothetical protein KGJ62_01545 [Armatimonadetes bacterium]|nr:hypothetical protein [Armatimonadota bacterium]MDE2205464.1 hypothetical protein [Armatimonadota bacterium]
MIDERHVIEGTHLQVRWFIDEDHRTSPVFVFEELPESTVSFTVNRENLAAELSEVMKTTPDRLMWYEQAPDSRLTEFVFRPGYIIQSEVPREKVEQMVGHKLDPYPVRMLAVEKLAMPKPEPEPQP